MDFEDNLIQLVDEDGEEFDFEHIMTFDYQDKQYIVLMPVDDEYYESDDEDDEDDEDELAELDGADEDDFDDYDDEDEDGEDDDGEIIILEVVKDEEGNDVYLSIEDDDLLDELYNVYIQTAESLE